MDNGPTSPLTSDTRAPKRGRLMGKLFGSDKKVNDASKRDKDGHDLDDFFHAPDKLDVAHPAPPVLAKLDIASATRPPSHTSPEEAVFSIQQHKRAPPPPSRPRRDLKGLVVRFVDTCPEVIGNGGDECDVPVSKIATSRKPRPQQAPAVVATHVKASRPVNSNNEEKSDPLPLRRTPTGFSSTGGPPGSYILAPLNVPAHAPDAPVNKQDGRPRSLLESHGAEMRQAEGLVFASAVRAVNRSGHKEGVDWRPVPSPTDPVLTQSPESVVPLVLPSARNQPASPQARSQPPSHHSLPRPRAEYSAGPPPPDAHLRPAPLHYETPEARAKRLTPGPEISPVSSMHSQSSSVLHVPLTDRLGTRRRTEREIDAPSSRKASLTVPDAAFAHDDDDALDTFVARSRHLFELLRLHSESVKLLVACQAEELIRASLWWFLKGRSALESVIRERPSTADAQRYESAKQQAHADLAKAYWLVDEIYWEVVCEKQLSPSLAVDEARTSISSSLRKLAMSLKRNRFLPPEEALLPAHLDRTIWLEYPPLSQDIVALLQASTSSSLVTSRQQQQQPPVSRIHLLESLPLGDTASVFCFGRVFLHVFLVEQGMETQQVGFPCLLSITRPRSQPDMTFVVASQNGVVHLRISGNKNAGPTWEDTRWQSDSYTLHVKLPRGFALVLQCSEQDYRMLWSMYDVSTKIQATIHPSKEEECVFRSTLRSFHYLDNDPQARQFPREAVPACELALFEKLSREGAAKGPRNYHRGLRIAVITGPRTKTLRGVNQSYTPQMPIQLARIRGDRHDPALSIAFERGKFQGSMVFCFPDENERLRMHTLLTGAALRNDEHVCCEVPLQGLWFSEQWGESKHPGFQALSSLDWQTARIINEDSAEDRPSCVLSERLRVVVDGKQGSLTDRVNIAPGELKLRLETKKPTCLLVLRQAQQDLTVAITDNPPGTRDRSLALAQALESMQQSATIRTYFFATLDDLHQFETALTGFRIVYDGIAAAFSITRRRMVVPLHKKWDAGTTRLQIVHHQDGVLQLLAFFDDFAHGECMGFTLKGSDVFETFSRGGKAGLKMDDAKFPLPRVRKDGVDDDAQTAGDAAFLCLDLPELPGERDDISILFDNEADRQKLVGCLPAPVKGARMTKTNKGSVSAL